VEIADLKLVLVHIDSIDEETKKNTLARFSQEAVDSAQANLPTAAVTSKATTSKATTSKAVKSKAVNSNVVKFRTKRERNEFLFAQRERNEFLFAQRASKK